MKFRVKYQSSKLVFLALVSFLGLLPFTEKPESNYLKTLDAPLRSFAVIIGEFAVDAIGGNSVSLDDPEPVFRAQAKTPVAETPFDFKNKNVLTIFIEGFSARWMSNYGSIYSDLTPNLDRLYSRSIVAKNYYNHTAATYRGLRGQIFSLVPPKAGPDLFRTSGFSRTDKSQGRKWIDSLEALRMAGYKNYFYLSQQNSLNEMLASMGFDEVNGSRVLQEKYGSKSDILQTIKDRDLFDYMLKDLVEKNAKGERFFAGVYNIDTHNGFDADLNYRGLGNEVLNRMHKFDQIFAEFLEKFVRSNLFENTVLIVTADHSTFTDIYARSADPSVSEIFADTIPFMVFGKGIKPDVIDARFATSMAFMPTVIEALDIRNEALLMAGCSLFETCMANKIIAYGDKHFVLEDNKVINIEHSGSRKEYLQLIWKAEAMSRFLQ